MYKRQVIQGIKEQGWRINELRQLNMNVENINCFILALQVKNSDISDETAVKELNNIDGVYYIEEDVYKRQGYDCRSDCIRCGRKCCQ